MSVNSWGRIRWPIFTGRNFSLVAVAGLSTIRGGKMFVPGLTRKPRMQTFFLLAFSLTRKNNFPILPSNESKHLSKISKCE